MEIYNLISFPVEWEQKCNNSIAIRDKAGDTILEITVEDEITDREEKIAEFVCRVMNENFNIV